MRQPFAVASDTLESYRRYVRTSFPLRDATLDAQREELIDGGLLWADLFVSLARPGTTGPKLATLSMYLLERTLQVPWGFDDLYAHQQQAIMRLLPTRAGGAANTLILSGTGSGKTEGFLIPIIDACLRDPGPGVKALVIYPMNALANDQLNRLRKLLADAPEVTFGRYTGDAPEVDTGDERRAPRPRGIPPNMLWSRQAMRDNPPNILLTNYTQLEYLLLRRRDAELFRYGPPRYLVVDEIHLFTGVLGSEVACLLRRLRQHTGAAPGEICCVGTSATAGEEELPRLLEFAQKLFGASFEEESAVVETPAPFRPAAPAVPPPPAIGTEDLSGAQTPEGLSRLAKRVFGIDLPPDSRFGARLGDVIDEFATVSILEHALERPAPIDIAAAALGRIPERRGVTADALAREAVALVLLGAAATQVPVGEEDPEPRFRPRIHQVVRSLAGLWRCVRPECGHLARPGEGRCRVEGCGAIVRPLATCRTCGEAYWMGVVRHRDMREIESMDIVEPQPNEAALYLADPRQLGADFVSEDEEGGKHSWEPVAICPSCSAVSGAPGRPLTHDPGCPTPTGRAEYLGSTDNVHCPSCGDIGARDRPILLPLRGSAAASVAVLTYGLNQELRSRESEAGGRLLVFADSRQDAAQQAGYADDQGGRVAVRQLIAGSLTSTPQSMTAVATTVKSAVTGDPKVLKRWLIGESGREFEEVAKPDYVPPSEREEDIERQLEWEIVLELTERARRRFSLEREGLVVVDIDKLDELVASVVKSWPDHPFGDQDRLRELIRAVVDLMRYKRAVDHWMLKRTRKELIKNHVRVGDRGVTATRGFASTKFRGRGVDIRPWTAPKNATSLTELVGRVLAKRAIEANEVVEALASRLGAVGLFTKSAVESRTRMMVDHKRLVLSTRGERGLWRCDRCGSVRSALLTDLEGNPLCINWRCRGRPAAFAPSPTRDFYRAQYLSEPRRLIVREHSAQISSDERIALEDRFNDRDHPTVDVLACTPTLEVGVSLDDLHSIVLRNLPPTPANYAQRVGRAGRRSKVSLAFGHAGHGPHDTYFFEHPEELIAGLVRAPSISLENEPLLRRHVNSLIIETLGVDLPGRWVPPIEAPEGFDEPTVADSDGVIRETTLQPFAERLADPAMRHSVEDAVRGAFNAAGDPSPPKDAERIVQEQLDGFLENLRAALNRWCDRYHALLRELIELRRAGGLPTKVERDREERLRDELVRMAEPRTPEYLPLGFLGLVGFLPRYGFTGESVLLHPPRGEEPIAQSGVVAVTEFAPGNTVYARGRKMKVQRLDPAPVPQGEAEAGHRDNLLREGHRCDACEFLTFDPLMKTCPTCGSDLVAQSLVEFTGVSASGSPISSDDEYRSHSYYDVGHILGGHAGASDIVTIAGTQFERTSGRDITVANRGPAAAEGERPIGFEACLGCGFAAETQKDEEPEELGEEQDAVGVPGHAPRCPGAKDKTVVRKGLWLTARIRGDAMEMLLPEGVRGEKEFESWRATLAEALRIGIRETMQAGQRDLGYFIRQQNGGPYSLVIYDTMPGGTGYLPKLFENGAAGLKAAAEEALNRLSSCECSASCHRCLRDFWNQRLHRLFNRFEVFGMLRRLAEGKPTVAELEENEKLESFLEQEFFDRLRAAGLPTPTLQVVREVGGPMITIVDAEYRDPDVSIYLDGREYHVQSIEKIQHDLARRNVLEDKGVLVLEFTYYDVMARFDEIVTSIRRALKSEQNDDPLGAEIALLPGLKLVGGPDMASKRAVFEVDAAAWRASEDARAASLRSANRLRLAGWRIRREVGIGAGEEPA